MNGTINFGMRKDLKVIPADQEVLFHCHQLMALTCHVAHLVFFLSIGRRHNIKMGGSGDKKRPKATSSETAASPGATLCKWTNGRRNIRAKYCKDAWRETISTVLQCVAMQAIEYYSIRIVLEYLSHGLWDEVPVGENPSRRR